MDQKKICLLIAKIFILLFEVMSCEKQIFFLIKPLYPRCLPLFEFLSELYSARDQIKQFSLLKNLPVSTPLLTALFIPRRQCFCMNVYILMFLNNCLF